MRKLRFSKKSWCPELVVVNSDTGILKKPTSCGSISQVLLVGHVCYVHNKVIWVKVTNFCKYLQFEKSEDK